MNNRKEPWEAYPKVWPTKAKFFSWLQNNIHKEVYCGIQSQQDNLPSIEDWSDIEGFIKIAMFVKPAINHADSGIQVFVRLRDGWNLEKALCTPKKGTT